MFSRIVVAAHPSTTGRAAVDTGLALGKAFGATVHLVHAFDDPQPNDARSPERVHAEAFLDSLTSGSVVPHEAHAVTGNPADAVLQVAEEVDADLVVVGNQGMHGVRRVLRSTPKSIAHGAPCSVLIVDTDAARPDR